MKTESIAYGIAGVVFGLIAGWVIGAQQAQQLPRPAAAVAQTDTSGGAPVGGGAGPAPSRAPIIDEAQAKTLADAAARDPKNAAPRIALGNLYFDAEKYDDAIKWYSEAVKLSPNDPNLSTDLGVSYYYINQPDKALEQFDHSLKLDPKHAKTLLNMGVVKAFGKQDLQGATDAWQKVVALAPDSPEGQAAKRALDGLRSAHSGLAGTPTKAPGQ